MRTLRPFVPSPCGSGSRRCPSPPRSLLATGILGSALLVLGACDTAPGGDAVDLAIRNVHIVDVERGEVLRDRSITVSEGRIAAILDGSEEPPGAARTLDGAGGYLIPGLWDMHVHFRGGDTLIAENRELVPLFVATGVTSVRDGGGDITHAILDWRREIEGGELIGPRIFTSGPKLDGPTGGWDGSIRLHSPADVASALDSLEALGVDYVKIYDGTTGGDTYLEIIRESKRRDLIVTGHMPLTVPYREAVAQGLDASDHLHYPLKGTAANEDSVIAAIIEREGTEEPLGFGEALTLLREAYDPEVARATYELMAEHGTAVVPTLHIGQVLAYVEATDHGGDEGLRYIPPAVQRTYERRVEGARRGSPEARARGRAQQEHFRSLVPEMHEAGVTILAGSDAGPYNSFVYPGFGLHSELEELVAVGLSPAQALRAATSDAARFLRQGDSLGQVREGYEADLVLLEANPLEEIRNTRRVSTVLLRGLDVFEREDLDGILEERRH